MGHNFVFVQVKTILSILFRAFELEMVSKTMPKIDYEAMVVGPKGDCCVMYKRRSRVEEMVASLEGSLAFGST